MTRKFGSGGTLSFPRARSGSKCAFRHDFRAGPVRLRGSYSAPVHLLTVVARTVTSLLLLTALLALPMTASAHVNRTVGRYSFFLVLIEEPLFETNRAGFEFRVRDGDRQIDGLERTLQAVATSSTSQVSLIVSAVDTQGFYDVETDTTGRPFDPGTGGDWTLRLTGTVEGTAVDVSFPTAFPAYPRVATATRPAAARATTSGVDVWILVEAGLLVAAAAWFGRKVRRRWSAPAATV